LRALALVALFACNQPPPPAAPPTPAKVVANDVVTAVIDDWSATHATLTLWHHDERGWRHDKPWQGVIGHAGAAWGIGLHGTGAPAGHAGPVKHEGDGASPAGVFAIAGGFGFDTVPKTDLPYTVLRDTTECVDDPQSKAYDTIVEHSPQSDWTSSEHMRSVEGYKYGLVIAHNPSHTPGAGSCIFVHVWSGPDSNTVGCTAMPMRNVFDLLQVLEPDTVFVLLPRAEYRALQDQWGLPPQ
jgi:D-alanyl-D-alanine dipeptidase